MQWQHKWNAWDNKGADLGFVFCYKDASISIKAMSPEAIIIPSFPLEKEKEKEDLKKMIQKMSCVTIGSGLGYDQDFHKTLEFVLE